MSVLNAFAHALQKPKRIYSRYWNQFNLKVQLVHLVHISFVQAQAHRFRISDAKYQMEIQPLGFTSLLGVRKDGIKKDRETNGAEQQQTKVYTRGAQSAGSKH